MSYNLNKDNKGFTIIEVLIVLAIAGLIMLIVFLAIPALQRNQRNNARNSEASRISAAISECLANRNGSTTACAAVANLIPGDRTHLTTITPSADAAAANTAGFANTTTAAYAFGSTCTDGTSATAGGATGRAFAVVFGLEGSGGAVVQRCISSE